MMYYRHGRGQKGALAISAILLFALCTLMQTVAFGSEQDPGIYFVPDVEAQFAELSQRPDGLAFSIEDSPDPRICKHYQGLARVNDADGTPYLLVSRSGNQPDGIGAISCPLEDDDPGNLLIVELGSRPTHGERLRSNRLRRDSSLVGFDLLQTPPDSRDRVVRTIDFDGNDWPNYAHPGGMQVLDDVLVLAIEEPYEQSLEKNLFMFIDVRDPTEPTFLSSWEPPNPGGDFSAGLVGITPIANGDGECCNYVMIATGKKNTDVRFYRSIPTDSVAETTDLRSDALEWEETDRFTESQIEACLNIDNPLYPLVKIDWHTGSGDSHQALNFVREGGIDGPLYMIGLRNDTKFPSGDDRMDLYRIHLTSSGAPESCFIELVDTTHFTSYPYMGGGDSANFAAASGVYISPSGELIVYAAEYENDGPLASDGKQAVRFGEYRHRNIVRSGSPSLRPSADVELAWTVDEGASVELSGSGVSAKTKAWIQLYEDDGAGGGYPGFDSNRWIAVDYPDRNVDDFDDFSKLSFDDNAGSWRWFAPSGCTIHAYKDDHYSGGFKMLIGDGTVEVESNLDDIGFDDVMSSVEFQSDCANYYAAPIYLAWDLDGTFDFDTYGDTAMFDAAMLDGPTNVTVLVRAEHEYDSSSLGRSNPVAVTVHVENVAPSINLLTITNSLGDELPVYLAGLPLELRASFTDPGVDDAQSASLNWGDGTVDINFDYFVNTTGGVTGELRQSHTFELPGTYAAILTVTDDDGGFDLEGVSLEVVDAAGALETAVDLLAAAQTGASADVTNALQTAIDWLIGNNGATADNGAIDALEADDPASAISHIVQAIDALMLAESLGGPDSAAIAGLLGLSAEYLAAQTLIEAETVLGPPSPGEAKQLAKIRLLIVEGHDGLLDGAFIAACGAFRQAVEKSLRLIAE